MYYHILRYLGTYLLSSDERTRKEAISKDSVTRTHPVRVDLPVDDMQVGDRSKGGACARNEHEQSDENDAEVETTRH